MAKKLNAETAAEVGHNQLSPEQRQELIEQVISDLDTLDKQRREFNSKAALRRKAITSEVRGKLGYTMKIFLDEFVKPFEEKEDKDEKETWDLRLQAKAEAARFLKIGEQLTLFGQQAAKATRAEAAREKAEGGGSKKKATGGRKKKAEAVDDSVEDDDAAGHTDTVEVAGEKGFEAGSQGKNKDTNPYENGSRHYQAWNTNWIAAQNKIARSIGETPARVN